MKLQVSVSSSTILLRGLPAPWPALVSRRSKIGWSEVVAAGADVIRVAEVEHSLEDVYLELVESPA